MFQKLRKKRIQLWFVVIGILIISMQGGQTQHQVQAKDSASNSKKPVPERHQDTRALLSITEKLNAQIDSIVFLLATDLPKTNAFLGTIEERLNQIDNDAQTHGVSLLIDRVKLSTLRETVLYYRSILCAQNYKETRKLSA